MGKVLQKQKELLCLLEPIWPAQTWWPTLIQLIFYYNILKSYIVPSTRKETHIKKDENCAFSYIRAALEDKINK
jgi:hypothetical protein